MTDAGRVVGLVTLSRIRSVPVDARATTPVAAIACPLDHVPIADPDDPLGTLIPRLVTAPDRRALVFEGGVLVGIVSATDVTRAMEIREVAHTG